MVGRFFYLVQQTFYSSLDSLTRHGEASMFCSLIARGSCILRRAWGRGKLNPEGGDIPFFKQIAIWFDVISS